MKSFPYQVGDIVYIDPAIKDIHPYFPIAGEYAIVARNYFQASIELARIEDKKYKNLVTVQCQDNFFNVEEEYIVQH